jgi:hypothetical protein
MKSALVERDISFENSIDVANNFTENFISSDTQLFEYINEDKKNGKIIYIFSGNVGKFQRVTEITRFFLELDSFDGVFYILGDGEELPEITNLLNNHDNKDRVRLLGLKSFYEANQLTAQCDYGIVSLNPEITKYAYPSKFATYLSMGLKVLAFVDKNSQISTEIEKYKLGFVIQTCNELQSVLSESLSLKDEERLRIRAISEELFGKDILVNKNRQLLENII